MNIITELETYLSRAKEADGDIMQLSGIMTEMEQKYEIPWFMNSFPEWEKRFPDARRILTTYRYIASLRRK